MTGLLIMHISDIHFAAESKGQPSPREALEAASDAVLHDFGDAEIVLVLSGDVTTTGNTSGYVEALRALESLKANLNITKVVVCPGNHDIERVAAKEFRSFNKFAFSLTNDPNQCWNEAHAVRIVSHGDYDFVLGNTSFHGDYRTGKVPLKDMKALLTRDERPKIVVIHHSPIASEYGGGGLAEAYELLSLISGCSAIALLHGHVHSDQAITVGRNQAVVCGVGSIGFRPDPNMNNQFAMYEFNNRTMVTMTPYQYRLNRGRFFRMTV
ncbi:metallophosphoesterase family protein [Sinomonas sp. P10A9]|uniref:Metallophosphoesterase n=1 Tax=Sinomonas puerhi TaxID=3238584 RepID=A0AB39L2M3_9MICC